MSKFKKHTDVICDGCQILSKIVVKEHPEESIWSFLTFGQEATIFALYVPCM